MDPVGYIYIYTSLIQLDGFHSSFQWIGFVEFVGTIFRIFRKSCFFYTRLQGVSLYVSIIQFGSRCFAPRSLPRLLQRTCWRHLASVAGFFVKQINGFTTVTCEGIAGISLVVASSLARSHWWYMWPVISQDESQNWCGLYFWVSIPTHEITFAYLPAIKSWPWTRNNRSEYHRIGWWENLQESSIFDGKNPGFL